jgi:hypothetical protein
MELEFVALLQIQRDLYAIPRGVEPGRFRIGLVVADDAHGRWTNRYASEFSHRFEATAFYKRGWVVGAIWTSEIPTQSGVREEVLTAVHRAAYMARFTGRSSLAAHK